jgi:hypothetical protein
MELTRGKQSEPQRVVVYGPEGIGKSTLASQMPDPVFIDVEGSTSDMDVARAPTPSSWRALNDLVADFVSDHHGCKTLVIDTADWAERLAIAQVCSEHNLTSLGGQEDYGKSYNLLEREWGRFLDGLSRVAASGMHVCLTAHAKTRKFELPDQDGSFDRWELKLEKKTGPMLKEWGRMVLLCNYKTYVVASEKKGDTPKAKGGHRVMYTSHHPCWDAKNRVELPDECKLDYASISHCFDYIKPDSPAVVQQPEPQSSQQSVGTSASAQLAPLFELLKRDDVTEHELQLAVAKRGYYPADTPLENYDPQFVAGKLVAHWGAVRGIVDEVRKEIAS